MALYSIGYGNRDIGTFVKLLQQQQTDILVDVRSKPHSGYQEDYNRGQLNDTLSKNSIRYQWMGDLLGGRPQQANLYDQEGYVDYLACQEDFLFTQGFVQLEELDSGGMVVALMCSELRPEQCHRSRLLGEGLSKRGFDLNHIDERGNLISQQEVVLRITGGQESLLGLSPSSPLARSDRPIGGELFSPGSDPLGS